MITTIFFDLDGTLVNSLPDIADASNHALMAFGLKPHDLDSYKYFAGKGAVKLIENIAPECDEKTREHLLAHYLEYYKEHCFDKSHIYDGVYEALIKLKNDGYRICVISNKPHDDAVIVVEKYFPSVFHYIAGKKEGFPPKPDPALTVSIMEELSVSRSECVFVGDTEMDYATGKNAGLVSIAVSWGFRTRAELEAFQFPYIIDEPSELHELIKRL